MIGPINVCANYVDPTASTRISAQRFADCLAPFLDETSLFSPLHHLILVYVAVSARNTRLVLADGDIDTTRLLYHSSMLLRVRQNIDVMLERVERLDPWTASRLRVAASHIKPPPFDEVFNMVYNPPNQRMAVVLFLVARTQVQAFCSHEVGGHRSGRESSGRRRRDWELGARRKEG
jgi:hypothetical protein